MSYPPCVRAIAFFYFFFFNDTATTEIYTLSLHDALPICPFGGRVVAIRGGILHIEAIRALGGDNAQHIRYCLAVLDRKSTRLNSSHPSISYAVFCLKKKKT